MVPNSCPGPTWWPIYRHSGTVGTGSAIAMYSRRPAPVGNPRIAPIRRGRGVGARSMASRIGQIIPADGWYAVYARTGAAARGRAAPGSTRPSSLPGAGAVPEFVPVLAWALIFDDSDGKHNRVVGVVMGAGQVPEVMRSDDPSFLGYAAPGDPGVDRTTVTPDWRGMAREAIAQLKQR